MAYGMDAGWWAIQEFVDQSNEAAEKAKRDAAKRRQRELDAIAAQRSALAAEQYNRMQQLQAQQQRAMSEQSARAANLKLGYEQQFSNLQTTNQAQLAAINAKAETDLYNLKTTNSAVTSSLQILGEGTRKQAPTAQTSKRSRKSGNARTTQANLRIGSQANTSGANFSI